MIGLLGIPNPLNLPGDLVRAIGLSIDQGIADGARWAVGGMQHALVASTAVDLHSWFSAPWSAMVALAAALSGGILLVGVIHGALTGRGAELARRGLGATLALALMAGPGALASAGALVDVTSAACGLVVHAALGPAGFAGAFDHLPTDAASIPGTPLVAGALLAIVVGLLAFVIWVELALRAGAIYLVVAFLPVGLAGLFWAPAARWLRRLVEILVAVVASQLVITIVMVLAAADLSHAATTATTAPTARLDGLVTTIALLMLGSFGLPMALRLVPHAAEAAHLHGGGGRSVSSATRALSADSASAPALGRLTRAAASGGAAGVGAVGLAAGAGALRRGLGRATSPRRDRPAGPDGADGQGPAQDRRRPRPPSNGAGAGQSGARDRAPGPASLGRAGQSGARDRAPGPASLGREGRGASSRPPVRPHPEDGDG